MEQLLPIAFKELPDEVWKPLAELSTFFRDLCSTILKHEDLDVMEKNISIILCKLERIFPPAFFDIMEHLPIHLIEEARNGGPVQFRWMYPFDRFLGKIKKTVMQKAQVEGSICETSHFCSYYFQDHVLSLRTRVCRNDDGGIDASIQPTLSIFNQPGRASGASKTRFLTDREFKSATLHVLLNCNEVQDFVNYYVDSMNIADEDLSGRFEFIKWFKDYVHNPSNGITNPFLRELAWDPHREVRTWPKYFVNGFKFHTKSWGENKKTMNCGVWPRGSDGDLYESDYYGILNEIIELKYLGEHVKKVVLFHCDWFDPTPNRGTRVVHPESKIVEVRQRGRYGNYDPFIIAQKVQQVYYVLYPGKIREKVGWLTVLKTKPKGRVDVQNSLEVAYQNDLSTNINTLTSDELVEPLHDHNNLIEDIDVSEIQDVDHARVEHNDEEDDFINDEEERNLDNDEDEEEEFIEHDDNEHEDEEDFLSDDDTNSID